MKAIACSNYRTLEINTKQFGQSNDFEKTKEVCRKNIAFIDEIYGGAVPSKYRKEYNTWKTIQNYSRHGVSSTYGGKGTISHEYAHTISDQYWGLINGGSANAQAYTDKARERTKKVNEAYNKAMTSGDIYNISYYASTNRDEFLAEVFAAREMGETLPDYINEMLNEVFDGKL